MARIAILSGYTGRSTRTKRGYGSHRVGSSRSKFAKAAKHCSKALRTGKAHSFTACMRKKLK